MFSALATSLGVRVFPGGFLVRLVDACPDALSSSAPFFSPNMLFLDAQNVQYSECFNTGFFAFRMLKVLGPILPKYFCYTNTMRTVLLYFCTGSRGDSAAVSYCHRHRIGIFTVLFLTLSLGLRFFSNNFRIFLLQN